MTNGRQIATWLGNCLTIAVLIVSLFVPILGANAQLPQAPGSDQVTMMLFKIVKSKGQKYLVTQTGDRIPISGENLAKDATTVAVYRDASQNYWFINKEGAPTPIPPQKVQWAINVVKSERAAEFQGYQPVQNTVPGSTAPVQQTTIIQSPQSGSSGGGAVVTAAAAMGGGLLGGMIGGAIDDNNHYYGMPYGAPMYHDGAGVYHYNPSGSRVYVNNEHNNQISNQFNQQGDWDHRNQWSNNLNDQPHPTANNAAENHAGDYGNRGHEGFGGGGHEGWGGFHHFGGGGFRGGRR